MNFSFFYFSGTGNTKWAVSEFRNRITQKGHKCTLYSIEDDIANLQEIIKDTDVIGIAFPVYGANMPSIMQSFVSAMCDLDTPCKNQYFIITTSGYIDAYGPLVARKMLNQKKFKQVGYINIKMSNNISTPKVKSHFISREKMRKRMHKGKSQIEKLISNLTHQKIYIRNIGFYLLPGILIRRASENAKKNNYQSLSVDNEKCSQCMICVDNCPTKSIVFLGKEFDFLSTCTACMRCYNFCPKHAICHEGRFADPSVYRRYIGPETIL